MSTEFVKSFLIKFYELRTKINYGKRIGLFYALFQIFNHIDSQFAGPVADLPVGSKFSVINSVPSVVSNPFFSCLDFSRMT